MRPLRNPAFRRGLSWLLAGWFRLCYATLRWTHEGREHPEAVWRAGGGAIMTFWHSRLALAPAAWPIGEAQPLRSIISMSQDGRFIAETVARLGIPAIHGSSEKPGAATPSKRGAFAFRQGLNHLKSGGALTITPDGPRGPARQMAEGLPVMARKAGCPVLFVGLSCRPCIRLGSWDRTILPLPFGRAAMVWDMATYPEGAEPDDVAQAWTARMKAVEERADVLLGLAPETA